MSFETPVRSMDSFRLSRRALVAGAGGALAVAAIGRTAIEAQDPVIEGRTYLAALPNGVHLAIVVSSWDAMAFVADGAGRADFFTGVSNRSMTLVAADGARLTASIGAEGFKGRVVNADDTAFTFVAAEAIGVAGLYSVEITEGYASGTSMTGGRLMAGIVQHLDDGGALIHGLATREGFGSCALTTRLSPASRGTQRWIVQADGLVAGGCSDDQGSGFAVTSGNED